MILALDTSDSQASVALRRDGMTLAEFSWDTGGHHSRHLHVAIGQVLDLLELAPGDLSAIVVAKGPGSFSGIRVGVSFAKGLAMALDVPLAGISTLDTIAYQASACGGAVWAVLPAGRSQYYTAHFEGNGNDWHRVSEYLILSEAGIVEASQGALLAGPAAATLGSAAAAQRLSLQVAASGWHLRRAAFLAELGEDYFRRGGHDESSVLEPLYLRRSSAEEKRAATQE